jgi:hypothetical protein
MRIQHWVNIEYLVCNYVVATLHPLHSTMHMQYKYDVEKILTLLEILSFATYLMQLKSLTCNYFGVACNMCSCMRHFLVA